MGVCVPRGRRDTACWGKRSSKKNRYTLISDSGGGRDVRKENVHIVKGKKKI